MDLVREDFFEVWHDGQRIADDLVPFEEAVRPLDGRPVLEALFPLPAGATFEDVHELRVGQEWKIDGFHVAGDSAVEPGT